jgi:hypothetical protein
MYTLLVNQFLAKLEHIPWFKQLGQASIHDIDVFRIYTWQTWPGPEDPGATIQAQYYRRWHDDLFQTSTPLLDDPLTQLWNRIHDTVFERTRTIVPYQDDQDAYYGPNAAVWQASFTAALVGCVFAKYGQFQVPERADSQWTLQHEWKWFVEGHWPCSYFWPWGYTDLEAVERTGVPRRLIVY